jgi:tripartite-type tricarboxylate transporter receptor subunit TctC
MRWPPDRRNRNAVRGEVVNARRSFLAGTAALTLLIGIRPSAFAQAGNWPDRAIKVVVPFPPGGSADILGRLVADGLTHTTGQSAIVENRPGAGANIGTEYVAMAKPDGYTILLQSNNHVSNPSFFLKLPYDPVKDFEPVSLVGTVPMVLTVNANKPVTNLKEFLAWARTKKDLVTFGSAGVGTPHHLAAELLQAMTGIKMLHVPYKGAAQLVPALLAEEVDCAIWPVNSVIQHIKAGKLRAIAVSASTRSSILPDIPTIAEAGPLPGYSLDLWLGVLAPAGTPRPIVDRLNAEILKMLRDPKVKEKLDPIGIEPSGTTPEKFAEVIKSDLVKYAKIAKDANIKPE